MCIHVAKPYCSNSRAVGIALHCNSSWKRLSGGEEARIVYHRDGMYDLTDRSPGGDRMKVRATPNRVTSGVESHKIYGCWAGCPAVMAVIVTHGFLYKQQARTPDSFDRSSHSVHFPSFPHRHTVASHTHIYIYAQCNILSFPLYIQLCCTSPPLLWLDQKAEMDGDAVLGNILIMRTVRSECRFTHALSVSAAQIARTMMKI